MKLRSLFYILLSLTFFSCKKVSTVERPTFLDKVNYYAALDSTKRTEVVLSPRVVYIEDLLKENFFYVKNQGTIPFIIDSIFPPNCGCITVSYTKKRVNPNDSIKIDFFVNGELKSSNAIVVVGNCNFGNQTFLIKN